MRHFDYKDFVVQFSMLHDQFLTDVSYDSGVLKLVFGEYRIFREDYSDDTYYERYKDYHECTVEITDHSFSNHELDKPTLCMLRGDRFKWLEMDDEALFDFLRSLRAQFTFASIANNDELELQFLSSPESEMKRKYRCCEYRLSVIADAINFIWK
ncbi:MAG TPA: hypothetical protein DCY72_05885 [Ruminococcaceae bacterium]|nr:hypothetical protein [Oscillospiraceae bacterium]